MDSRAPVIVLCLLACQSMASAAGWPDTFPESIRGGAWRLVEAPRTYAGEQLFELIDGGAPLYFEYGFLTAHAARYGSARGATVAVEVYTMQTDSGACGVFSYLAAGTGQPVAIGSLAVEGTGFILVWTGRHVWSFTDMDSAGADSVAALARVFAGRPDRPAIDSHLSGWFRGIFPGAEEVVLFRGPLGFQKHDTVQPDGSMHIRSGISGILPEGDVVALAYASAAEADSLVGVIVRRYAADPRVPGSPSGPHRFSHNRREFIAGRIGTIAWIVAAETRAQAGMVWKHLEEAGRK